MKKVLDPCLVSVRVSRDESQFDPHHFQTVKIPPATHSHFSGFLKAVIIVMAAVAFMFGVRVNAAQADPSASSTTKNVLNYLSNLPTTSSKRVVSGQRAFYGNWSEFQNWWTDIGQQTGHTPGLMEATDRCGNEGSGCSASSLQPLIDHWTAGGLVMVSMFHSNPKTGGSYKDTNFSARDFGHLLTPGNPVHTAYLHELDFAAGQLQTLQNAGVVVLYRTLHEMNGNWYWWSMGSATQYQKLWQMEFNYLTKTKRLHNLLFTWAPSAGIGNYASYYPGDAYVDITGLDLYAAINGSPVPLAGGYNELTIQVAPSKPFGLAEYGPLDPTNAGSFTQQDYYQLIVGIKQNMPKTTFWSSHLTKWSMGLANPGGAPSRHLNVGKLLSDPWVVNEGDINFSGVTPPPPPSGKKQREKP